MTSRKVFILFLFLIFLMAVIFFKEPYSNVDRMLAKMSQQERLALTDLFRGLIEDDCFGYTLFGNKPVTFESYFIKTPLSILDFLRDRNSYMIHRGQKVWALLHNRPHIDFEIACK